MEPKDKTPMEEKKIHITQRQYINGTLDVQRRIGILRHTPFVMALEIIILIFSVKWFVELYITSVVEPIDYCLFCVLVLLPSFLTSIFLNLLPLHFAVRAKKDYTSSPVVKQIRLVRLYRDHFELSGDGVRLTGYYSKMIQCLENDQLFLFIPDRSGLSYMIPKADLGELEEPFRSQMQKEMGKRYHKVSLRGRKDFGKSFDKGA